MSLLHRPRVIRARRDIVPAFDVLRPVQPEVYFGRDAVRLEVLWFRTSQREDVRYAVHQGWVARGRGGDVA